MFQSLRRRIRTFMEGPRPGDPAQDPSVSAAPVLRSNEARLQIHQRDGQVELLPDFAQEPMLVLPGRLAGEMSILRVHAIEGAALRGAAAMLRLALPLVVEDRQVSVEVTVELASVAGEQPLSLVRSRRRRLPPDSQVFEMVYGDVESEQVCYRVVLDGDVKPTSFRELAQNASVFQGVPSLSQMVAFLRATLHYRRTTMRSLASMARGSDESHVKALVERMGHQLSPSMSFACPELKALQEALQAHGVAANPNTVASLCLLVDIYLERIGPSNLERLCEEGERLSFSVAALVCAAAFFGLDYHPCGKGSQGGEIHSDCAVEADREAIDRARPFLQHAVNRRTVLTILADLAADSGSVRSQERVTRLLAAVPADQPFRSDEYAALQSYLEHHGRKVQTLTLLAVAIYVDFEAGILDAGDIDRVAQSQGFGAASLYSLLAIARTFDSPLRAFRVTESTTRSTWDHLARLAALAKGGLLVGFSRGEDREGVVMEHVLTSSDLRACRQRGLEPTGDLLAEFPIVHHIHSGDLERIRHSGHNVVARFVSEGRGVQWRSLSTIPAPPRGSLGDLMQGAFSFVEHYQIYHFNHSILAWRVPASPESLVGRSHVVAVYRDARDAEQYLVIDRVGCVEDVTTPPQQHWKWDGAILGFPSSGDFPRHVAEASHDHLVGAMDDEGSALQRLDLVFETMRGYLDGSHRLIRIELGRGTCAAAETLQRALESGALRALLTDLLDALDRDALLAILTSPTDAPAVYVGESLHRALENGAMGEFGALALVHALCRALPLRGGRSVTYHEQGFLELLVDGLFDLVGTGDPNLQQCALECMGSSLFAHETERRNAVSHVLCQSLDSRHPEVAEAAAVSLASFALRRLVSVGELVLFRFADEDGDVISVGRRRRFHPQEMRLEEMASEVGAVFNLGQEQQKLVVTMLARLLDAPS